MHFRAKVDGLLALDEIFRGAPLDFFILTSSISTVLGALGASTYAAVNRFMDVFALGRRQRGEDAWITVDWDGWREERPNEFSTKGAAIAEFSLNPEEGVEAFHRILAADLAHVIVSTGDLDGRLSQWAQPQASKKSSAAAPTAAATLKPAPVQFNTAASSQAAHGEIESVLIGIWSGLLGVTSVDITDNFFDLGGDSLLLMRVQVKIREAFNVNLAAAEMFEYPTISGLARRLRQPAVESADLRPVQDRAQMQRAAMARQRQPMRRG
jgi:acyl carrier protein